MSRNSATERLRASLAQWLESGLQTQYQQRAYSSEAIDRCVTKLQQIEVTDAKRKLIVAGFTAEPFCPEGEAEIEQSCATCMYYQRNSQFCNLPALRLPVEPHWSCVLWRI